MRSKDPRHSKMLLLSAGVLLIQGLWCLGALEGEDLIQSLEIRAPLLPLAPNNSSFTEFPSGDILGSLNPQRDAVLLLYAPWDRKQAVKGMQILQRLRSIFPAEKDLTLGAINCWNHKGPCYQRYFHDGVTPSKRQISYPQWLYVPKNQPLTDPLANARFFNGDSEDSTYEHILSFLMRQRYPIRVWKSREEWITDRARFGGLSLTGYLESLQDMREYIRSAEMIAGMDSKDNILPVGVILNKDLAKSIGVKRVKLFWWNGALELPQKVSLNRSTLVSWTKKCLVDSTGGQKYIVPELQTSSSKSFLLDNWLHSGSMISLLAFLKPGMGGNSAKELSILRETALLYLSSREDFAQNKNGVKELHEAFVRLRMSEDSVMFKHEINCKSSFGKELKPVNPCPHSLYHNDSVDLTFDKISRRRAFGDEISVTQSIVSTKISACLHLALKEIDMGCFGQRQKDSNVFMEESMKEELLGIHTGNKSLNFFYLNAESNSHLMSNMGLNPNDSQVLIDSLKDERRWKMESTFNAKSLSKFVWNFHYAQDSLHIFRKSKITLESCDSSDLCIPEISASNFNEVVLNGLDQNVVVLYQTTSCYFCAAARRSVHELKRFLDPVDFEVSRIHFVTIDGGANDLPIEYTSPVFPSLIFFPAWDKSRSKVYPLGEAFSTENVKKFIVGSMRPEEVFRIEAHWCGDACLRNKESQLQNALNQTSDSIQKEFSAEFEEIKRLLLLVQNIIPLREKVDDKESKYEFIKSFRMLMDGLYD